MAELGSLVSKVRSKNAGPFWLTVDVFCDDAATYERVRAGLQDAAVARLFGVDLQLLKRFDIPSLNVVKFSVPRPVVQGTRADRDMHGAGWACLLEEMEIA
ncbi:MAG: DUF4387 family protein [Rhodobacteraceae bacterium]|uniref:DUF4387 family protein n=1 Tax=Tabrizicola sp. SY72 TaxID=2741673 RepID=UPI001571DC45|nr:DUF4387 family protein [Tabrizicola sp. SY72]MBL9057081.1 DUF4387 family protein [Paracoccaceae bacterium]NTT86005.1 DUF4387 family protein [Tabrizicola sp. SY72]